MATRAALTISNGTFNAATGRRAHYVAHSFVFFSLGSVIQVLSYASIEPLFVGILVFILGATVLRILPGRDPYENSVFQLVFSICWFWAGVAAIYANQLDDFSQNHSDAWSFFLMSIGEADKMTLEEIRTISEGAGAVALWRSVYNLFAAIGFEKGRYIGISVNVFLVAMTAVVGLKTVRTVFGNDTKRLRRFTLLFSLCGIFWLFAAIHLRDAIIFFVVSALTLFWIRFMARPATGSLSLVTIATVAAFASFGFLREEFVFVPLAMMVAGVAAMALGARSRQRHLLLIFVLVAIAVPVVAYFFTDTESNLMKAMIGGKEAYEAEVEASHSADSLGMKLIGEAALPVRLVLGSAYLIVFPIPVWTGFQLESAYHLLKSLQALSMYAITPLFLLAAWRVLSGTAMRTAPILLLLFSATGLTLATAATSGETRHFGSFLVAILILSVLPDLDNPRERKAYKTVLTVVLGIMFVVHLMWLALKF